MPSQSTAMMCRRQVKWRARELASWKSILAPEGDDHTGGLNVCGRFVKKEGDLKWQINTKKNKIIIQNSNKTAY
jgi:hypothetical protein